jgi:hypothetical protein
MFLEADEGKEEKVTMLQVRRRGVLKLHGKRQMAERSLPPLKYQERSSSLHFC